MLEVKNLQKSYGDLEAVKGVSFGLKPGDIFGFIGSNGAGKTTTIRMLATLLEPTAGTATLNGIDVLEDPMQIRRMIGYMPDFFGLYDDVKVFEYLEFFASLYDVPPRRRPLIVNECAQHDQVFLARRTRSYNLCLGECSKGSAWLAVSFTTLHYCCSTSPHPAWIRERVRS